MTKTEPTNSIGDELTTSRAGHSQTPEVKSAIRLPGFPLLSLATFAASGCLVLYGYYYVGHGLTSDYSMLVSERELAAAQELEIMEPVKAREMINRQTIVFERLLASSLDPTRLLEYHQFLTNAVAKLERLPDQDALEISSFHRRTRRRIDEILLMMRQCESSNARAYSKLYSARRMLLLSPLSIKYLNTIATELQAAAMELSQKNNSSASSKFPTETANLIRDFAQWLLENQKFFTVDQNEPFSFNTRDSSRSKLQRRESPSNELYQEIKKDLANIETSIADLAAVNNDQSPVVSSPPLMWQSTEFGKRQEVLPFSQLNQLDSHLEYSDWSGFTEVLGEMLESQPKAQQNFSRRLGIAMLLRVCLELDGPRSGSDLAKAGELCFRIGAHTPEVNALLFHTAELKRKARGQQTQNDSAQQVGHSKQLASFASALDSEPGNSCTLITEFIQLGLSGKYAEADQVLDSMVLVAPDTIPVVASIALWRANDTSIQNSTIKECSMAWLKLLELLSSRANPEEPAECARLRWLILGSHYDDALSEAAELAEIYPEAAWIHQITEEANREMKKNTSGASLPKIDKQYSEPVQIEGKK